MRLLILLCLMLPFQAIAETSLWRISKGKSELFIGGTIHVLSRSDYPLPVEFERAYLQAKKIVFETDLEVMSQPEAQQQLLIRLMYKQGKTLKDDIKPSTYNVLKDYLISVGTDINNIAKFKPPMVMINLLMAELQRLDMNGTGVDSYFYQKAVGEGKSLGELESLQDQLDVMENLGKGHEDELILQTIAEMKTLSSIMSDMKKAWRTGNLKVLQTLGIADMKKDFPNLFSMLLVKRNDAWIPKIEALLTTPEVELVLVGALHLVSTEGVLAKLSALGYKIEYF